MRSVRFDGAISMASSTAGENAGMPQRIPKSARLNVAEASAPQTSRLSIGRMAH
jgi:hypothetical protein